MKTLAVLLLFLLQSHAHAFMMSADVEFDFYKGYINITPPEFALNSDSLYIGKTSGCCTFRFGLAALASRQALYNDSYLYLVGDPDDLAFQLVQYVCTSGAKPAMAIFTAWRFREPKGEIKVNSKFFSGHDTVDSFLQRFNPANKDRICTDGYRTEQQANRLNSLTSDRNYLHQSVSDRGIIHIKWFAKNWKDPELKDAEKTIQEVKEILNQNN